jgi:hypothetical protein
MGQYGSRETPRFLSNGLEGILSLGVKRPGREADHSPPSNAEAKNAPASRHFLSTLLSNILSLCSSICVSDQVNLILDDVYEHSDDLSGVTKTVQHPVGKETYIDSVEEC